MATKKQAVREAPTKKAETREVVDEEIEIPEDIASLEAEEKLGEFKRLFSDRRYQVRIEKKNEQGRFVTMTRVPFDEFDPFTHIQEVYGGGEYVCTLLDERARYMDGGRMSFLFGDLVAKKEEVKPKSPLEDPTVVLIIQMMKDSQANMLQMMQAFAPKPGTSDMGQMVEALSKLKGMTADKSGADMKSTLEMIATVKDLFGNDGGGGEDKGGVLSEIMEAVKMIPALRESGLVPRIAAPSRPPVRPAPAPGSVIPTKKEEVPVTDPVANIVNYHLPRFEAAAVEGAAVETWARVLDSILESEIVPALVKKYKPLATDDIVWGKLIDAAKSPDEVEKIFLYAPSLLPHREWVTNVIKACVEMQEVGPVEDGQRDEVI